MTPLAVSDPLSQSAALLAQHRIAERDKKHLLAIAEESGDPERIRVAKLEYSAVCSTHDGALEDYIQTKEEERAR